MGFSFRRSKKLGPVRLTLSKRGLGVSVGGNAGRIGIGATGRTTLSAGAGGLRYQKVLSSGKGRGGSAGASGGAGENDGADYSQLLDLDDSCLTPEDVALVQHSTRLTWHWRVGWTMFLVGFGLMILGAVHFGRSETPSVSRTPWYSAVAAMMIVLSIPWSFITAIRRSWNTRKLRQLAERLIAQRENAVDEPAAVPAPAVVRAEKKPTPTAERLIGIDALLKQGLITAEEHKTKRETILSEI